VVGQDAGGGEAVVHAETLARLVEMGVHGVLGDLQFAGDLLGGQVAVDQPQALPLTRGQLPDGRWGMLLHRTR
jgi:hypothetical protein